MPAKCTQDGFIKKAKDLYGDRYSYEDVVYVRSSDKVNISCKEHGLWQVTPGNFLSGKGCPKCGRNKLRDLFKHDTEEFIRKSNKIHGQGTYDYSLVDYKNSATSVKIICPKHGVWEQLPSNHSKYGCPTCASEGRGLRQRTSNENFIRELVGQHGTRYDYSLVEYTGLTKKIDIVCAEHGKFTMIAGVHKGTCTRKGADCPKCSKSGYNCAKPGSLYILISNDITKVGITNSGLSQRLRAVSRTSGKKFSVLTVYSFENGEIPDKVETELLRELRKTHRQPQERFDGSTECFYNVNLATLLNRIEELIASQTAAQAA